MKQEVYFTSTTREDGNEGGCPFYSTDFLSLSSSCLLPVHSGLSGFPGVVVSVHFVVEMKQR